MYILNEEYFADTDYSAFAVACRYLMGRIQIDHILPPCGWMPVEKPIGWSCAEDNAGGGESP